MSGFLLEMDFRWSRLVSFSFPFIRRCRSADLFRFIDQSLKHTLQDNHASVICVSRPVATSNRVTRRTRRLTSDGLVFSEVSIRTHLLDVKINVHLLPPDPHQSHNAASNDSGMYANTRARAPMARQAKLLSRRWRSQSSACIAPLHGQ